MNFFSWVRDGVRQAVLMGVSDAVGDIGTPPEGDDISQRLLEALRSGQPVIAEARSSDRSVAGRSLAARWNRFRPPRPRKRRRTTSRFAGRGKFRSQSARYVSLGFVVKYPGHPDAREGSPSISRRFFAALRGCESFTKTRKPSGSFGV